MPRVPLRLPLTAVTVLLGSIAVRSPLVVARRQLPPRAPQLGAIPHSGAATAAPPPRTLA